MRLRLAIVATGFALVVSALEAQSVDPALTAAIAARDQAAIKRDPAAMAKYTADDYASINPSGQLMTKKQRVDGLKTPAAPGSKPGTPLRTEALHVYGSGAAVARMKQDGNRQLTVWIKNPAGWQVVAIHVVPDVFLPQQPPPESLKAAGPSPVTAPSGLSGDRAAVFAAYKQIQDAVWSGDPATREKLTAPEFARLSPGLLRFGVAENQGVGAAPRKPPTHSDISVNAWDQLGVVRWREKTASGVETWLTRVLAKKGSAWQQVATASSAAGKPAIAP